MRVIARAYGDEPLDRVVVGNGKRVTYIAKASTRCSTRNITSAGVGFPKNCVFAFDPNLFRALMEAWKKEDFETLSRLWESASPLEPSAIHVEQV